MLHLLCHRWLAQIMQKKYIFQAGPVKVHTHATGSFNCKDSEHYNYNLVKNTIKTLIL